MAQNTTDRLTQYKKIQQIFKDHIAMLNNEATTLAVNDELTLRTPLVS